MDWDLPLVISLSGFVLVVVVLSRYFLKYSMNFLITEKRKVGLGIYALFNWNGFDGGYISYSSYND
ncbi:MULTISPECIES: hypothetical protein [Serratia]|uniref:hypothetical protein n=1 Tax=Serratia TaxID=613 RepID=UPI000B2FBD7F|nr:hypothetical protein [Serratia sp. 506_PEND]